MGVFESTKRVPSSKRIRNPFRKRTSDDNNNNSILTVDQEKSFDTVRDSRRNVNKGTKLKTNVIHPNSNTNLITRRHSTNPSQLVTQAAPNGNQLNVPSPLQPQRRTRASFSGQVSPETNVDELCAYTVSPRCKPNDFILIYRDLAELVTTSIRSVRSGVGIMLNDAPHLRRRALHEESQLGTSRSITRMQERNERKNLVLWWKPFYTLWYFLLECQCLLVTYATKLYHRKKQCLLVLVVLALLTIAYNVEGQHQQFVAKTEKKVLWWLYWVVLGIMSSVGLGTGLHTFVLYLGPFIASVTLAAYECKSLAFPEPPYPSSIECPEATDAEPVSITLWSIMSKVRVEAMMWGAGTAIGELPPYFMAKAARLSGHEDEVDDDDIEEILEIEEKEKNHPAEIKQMGLMERSKVYVHDLVHRVGFFGILACASIPNPLFDLAGITCGHFLVPFWTFFGATLIGKAVIKMHIQKLVVIFAFSQHHIEFLINAIKKIPKIGEQLGNPFREYLLSQRAKLHKDSTAAPTETPWLGWIFERLIIAMVAYFILSIINSFAQNYHKRLCANKRQSYMDGQKAH